MPGQDQDSARSHDGAVSPLLPLSSACVRHRAWCQRRRRESNPHALHRAGCFQDSCRHQSAGVSGVTDGNRTRVNLIHNQAQQPAVAAATVRRVRVELTQPVTGAEFTVRGARQCSVDACGCRASRGAGGTRTRVYLNDFKCSPSAAGLLYPGSGGRQPSLGVFTSSSVSDAAVNKPADPRFLLTPSRGGNQRSPVDGLHLAVNRVVTRRVRSQCA